MAESKVELLQAADFKLRKAAERIVDLMHAYGPHLIVLSDKNSSPVFALIEEIWKKKFKNKPLPQVKAMHKLSFLELEGRKVAVFHEVAKTGKTLLDTRDSLKESGAAKVKMFALLSAYHYPSAGVPGKAGKPLPLHPDIVVGGMTYLGASRAMGKGLVAALRSASRQISERGKGSDIAYIARPGLFEEVQRKTSALRELAHARNPRYPNFDRLIEETAAEQFARRLKPKRSSEIRRRIERLSALAVAQLTTRRH